MIGTESIVTRKVLSILEPCIRIAGRFLIIEGGVVMSKDVRGAEIGKLDVHGVNREQRARMGHVGDVRDATHGSGLQYGNRQLSVCVSGRSGA